MADRETPCRITMQMLDGDEMLLDVTVENTIRDVKALVLSKMSPTCPFNLVFASSVLGDETGNASLGSLGIGDGAVVLVVKRDLVWKCKRDYALAGMSVMDQLERGNTVLDGAAQEVVKTEAADVSVAKEYCKEHGLAGFVLETQSKIDGPCEPTSVHQIAHYFQWPFESSINAAAAPKCFAGMDYTGTEYRYELHYLD
eukprot:TRINITY_DN76748_c0_g1_i1.p1 TRINITY_DN76748_c0_g1~~TRINITY_DN76748_c0_g1_i1.p1  ORF type:complete len:199 (-),score=33.42 TRINITY_DN76748_c0_g1_i1:84-680(-)